MRGKTGSRGCYGGGNALYLRTRYCTPCRLGIEDLSDMVSLSDYMLDKGIGRHKVDGLLKRGYLLAMFAAGRYWVMEHPDNPPTDRELYRRLPKRKRHRSRGTFITEREWLRKNLQSSKTTPN